MKLHLLPAHARAETTGRLPAQRLFSCGINPALRLIALRDGGRFAYLACPQGVVLPNELISREELMSARHLSLETNRLWAQAAYGGLRRAIPRDCEEVVFYVSRHSHCHLAAWLVRDGLRVSCPLDGLGWVQQQEWIAAQIGVSI